MDEMEEIGEGNGPSIELLPPSSEAPPPSEEQLDFIPLSSVNLDEGEAGGRGLHSKSCDPWSRISELPPRLGEKMAELKREK